MMKRNMNNIVVELWQKYHRIRLGRLSWHNPLRDQHIQSKEPWLQCRIHFSILEDKLLLMPYDGWEDVRMFMLCKNFQWIRKKNTHRPWSKLQASMRIYDNIYFSHFHIIRWFERWTQWLWVNKGTRSRWRCGHGDATIPYGVTNSVNEI